MFVSCVCVFSVLFYSCAFCSEIISGLCVCYRVADRNAAVSVFCDEKIFFHSLGLRLEKEFFLFVVIFQSIGKIRSREKFSFYFVRRLVP
jgi:hypothetical protein